MSARAVAGLAAAPAPSPSFPPSSAAGVWAVGAADGPAGAGEPSRGAAAPAPPSGRSMGTGEAVIGLSNSWLLRMAAPNAACVTCETRLSRMDCGVGMRSGPFTGVPGAAGVWPCTPSPAAFALALTLAGVCLPERWRPSRAYGCAPPAGVPRPEPVAAGRRGLVRVSRGGCRVRSGSRSRRHVGQVWCVVNHGWRHSSWKRWLHGSPLTV